MASSTTMTMMGLISPSRGRLGSVTGPSPRRPTNLNHDPTSAGGAEVTPGEEAVVGEARIEVEEAVRRETDTLCLRKVHPRNTLRHHSTNTSPRRPPTGTQKRRDRQRRRYPTLASSSLAGRNHRRHKGASQTCPHPLPRHRQAGLARHRVRDRLPVALVPIS